MALTIIRNYIAREYGALDLLESLPSHESMEWVTLYVANPPTALVVGTTHIGRKILAFLVQHGDKPREIRYCLEPRTVVQHLPQEDVMQEQLFSPFKYIADTTKVAKRKSSILLKWYFMLKGLWTDGIVGDYEDYCKRFHDALRKIDAGRKAEEEGLDGHNYSPGKTPKQIEGSPDLDSASPYSLRPTRSTRDSVFATVSPAPIPPPSGPSEPYSQRTTSSSSNARITDHERLYQYMEQRGVLYLFDNIPDANSVDFRSNLFMPEAQSRKLFVGCLARDRESEIYAYMRPSRNVHEIRFWAERPGQRPFKQLFTEEVTKQRIEHPFNKTFPKDGHGVEQGDRARFTLMVKWYFIAAGIVTNVVLQETKAYPERLKSALEYIAVRMGPAAVKPPEYRHAGDEELSRASHAPTQLSLQPPIDENHIQSTLANGSPTTNRPAFAVDSNTPPGSPRGTKRTAIDSNTPPGSPRGTKRTAIDAHFADIRRTLEQDHILTTELGVIDKELEALDKKRMKFLEEWDKEMSAKWEKRNVIARKRGFVRKQFKRQSMMAVDDSDADAGAEAE